MLTAKTEEDNKIEGLAIGADDYITKPFSKRDLVGRVNAIIRRTTISIDYTSKESGCYAIIKDNTPIGIIEVVNNLKDADLEIWAKYIK